jgi:hypothetical protein
LNKISPSLLPALIAAALFSAPAEAQEEDCIELEGTPPGLYTTTDEGKTFLLKDGKMVEMGPGEAGFADGDKVACIKRPPAFLDWPCSTQAAQSRKFSTYALDEITEQNVLKEVVRRYFEIPQVIEPIPFWQDGEYHGTFNYNDLIQFASPDYWYFPDTNRQFLDPKRPKSLQVSLYVGINQVIIDNYAIDFLRDELGTNEIPVMFVFNDSNTVPISYFGDNASLEEIMKAFSERGIKLADPPIWWLGDHHLKTTIEEFEKFFEIPALADISPEKQEKIRADLEEHGFTRKPILVSGFAESGTMAVDQPERIRVAASMGIERFPTAFIPVEPDSYLARCGPGTPVGSGAVSGATTPIGGTAVPPGTPVVPPPMNPILQIDPEDPAPPIDPEEPASPS